MRRPAEIIAFLGLSAGLHLGAILAFGDAAGGPEAQGHEGADRITLAAAPQSVAALAARWAEPPQAVASLTTMPSTPPLPLTTPPALGRDLAPRRAAMPSPPLLPLPDAAPPTAGVTHSAPPPPPPSPPAVAEPPPRVALPAVRPVQRPDTASQPGSTPQAARTAQGQGGGNTAGRAVAPQPAESAADPARHQDLMAQWGAQIMARIERARPRAGSKGQVTLMLTLTRGGDLAGLSVAQSSGDSRLDAAALAAVRGAGRFPPAPAGLRDAHYSFSLPIRFR